MDPFEAAEGGSMFNSINNSLVVPCDVLSLHKMDCTNGVKDPYMVGFSVKTTPDERKFLRNVESNAKNNSKKESSVKNSDKDAVK